MKPLLTVKQAEKIIAVIKTDATGTGRLLGYEPVEPGIDPVETSCAIGGLLLAAGVSKIDLDGTTYPNVSQQTILRKHYGIDSEDAIIKFIEVNDYARGGDDTVQKRRRRLIALTRRMTKVSSVSDL